MVADGCHFKLIIVKLRHRLAKQFVVTLINNREKGVVRSRKWRKLQKVEN